MIVPSGRLLWGASTTVTAIGYLGVLDVLTVASPGPVNAVGGLLVVFALVWIGVCAVKAWPSLTALAATGGVVCFCLGLLSSAIFRGWAESKNALVLAVIAAVFHATWAASLPRLARAHAQQEQTA